MADLCTFRIPLIAANAVGALRRDFVSGLPAIGDASFHCTVDDTWCHVECSRDVALAFADALQDHVRGGITPLTIGAACSGAASIIVAAVRRFDGDAQRHDQSDGGMSSA